MLLRTAHDADLENANADDIARAIKKLAEVDAGFVVLSHDEQNFLQSEGAPGLPFTLEYREGAWNSHYSATDNTISAGDVSRAMQQYLVGDDAWKNNFTWTPVEEAMAKQGCLGVALMLLAPAYYGIDLAARAVAA